jgi:4'-phosphopantetheinyl transferase
LRKIISAYLAIAPDEAPFAYIKYGEPFISDDQNRGALSFNLSHSIGMTLCAVAWWRRVGIDIEFMRDDFAALGVAERYPVYK